MANQAAMDHIVGYNYQDCGGALDEMEAPMEKVIEASKKPVKYWEYQCHALSCLLVGGGKVRPGEMRRAIGKTSMRLSGRKFPKTSQIQVPS